ncbi:MAG: TMAO reductase system periplasmic protein TorT [Acidimicrobiales bacterium]|nr:TMAO reductase system periplasmic protein TorT [Acidimicrobiales bacterium]
MHEKPVVAVPRLTRRAVVRMLVASGAVAAGSLLAACGGGGATPTPAAGGAQPTAAPAASPTAAAGGATPAATEELWEVASYYGTYDVSTKQPGRPATSLQGPKMEKWTRPKANKPYMIGVSFPHLKDPYWLAVDYGIVDEAQILGVGIELVAAQGYNDLTGQINQVEDLANRADIEGIILAAISYASQDQLVTEIVKNKKKPVVEVINDIQAPDITAKALVSFYDMGYTAGLYVAEDSGGQNVTVVFLPGPAGSGWAPDTLDGFKAAVEEKVPGKVQILDVKWGDTGKDVQVSLIEDSLNAYPDVTYLVGNAVAIDAAPDILANRQKKPKLVSTYIIPPLYDKIAEGKVAAAPTDFTALQGRMAVDMMVRILNGEKPGVDFPFQSGPLIKIVTTQNYKEFKYEDMFGPRDFRPVFSVKPKA